MGAKPSATASRIAGTFLLLLPWFALEAPAHLALGTSHACALAESGAVKCWGANGSGQLGDGSTIDRHVPVDVPGLGAGAIALAAGDAHTCAVTSGGGATCWGANRSGQVGDGSTANRVSPTGVAGLASGVKAIAGGEAHTCAVTSAGAVKCWGSNLYAQLGDGTTVDCRTPVDVRGLGAGVVAVAVSQWQSCALTAEGSVKCWGQRGFDFVCDPNPPIVCYCGPYGCFCYPEPVCRSVPRVQPGPVAVAGLEAGVAAIAMTSTGNGGGSGALCAVKTDGALFCGGAFDGSLKRVATGGNGATAVAVASTHTCILGHAGFVGCWGDNVSGQLGDDTPYHHDAPPSPVLGLPSDVVEIAAGGKTTCALARIAGVFCWGWNLNGELGDGSNVLSRNRPALVAGLSMNAPSVLSGLWWNPSEPGWGVHVTQRGDIAFLAWFSYDASGSPKWFVASRCELSAPACPACVSGMGCVAPLYETSGPPASAARFDPAAVRIWGAGTAQVAFRDADNASFTLGLGTSSRTVPLVRQRFRTGTSPATDYTDLWWNAAEPGWGLAVTQQADVMFLVWFAYDNVGRPTWYYASNCAVFANGGGCDGKLYRANALVSGPMAVPVQMQPIEVGTVRLEFTDANDGVMTYTVEGVSGSRRITRQLF